MEEVTSLPSVSRPWLSGKLRFCITEGCPSLDITQRSYRQPRGGCSNCLEEILGVRWEVVKVSRP